MLPLVVKLTFYIIIIILGPTCHPEITFSLLQPWWSHIYSWKFCGLHCSLVLPAKCFDILNSFQSRTDFTVYFSPPPRPSPPFILCLILGALSFKLLNEINLLSIRLDLLPKYMEKCVPKLTFISLSLFFGLRNGNFLY